MSTYKIPDVPVQDAEQWALCEELMEGKFQYGLKVPFRVARQIARMAYELDYRHCHRICFDWQGRYQGSPDVLATKEQKIELFNKNAPLGGFSPEIDYKDLPAPEYHLFYLIPDTIEIK
jgi:hypothetical protein